MKLPFMQLYPSDYLRDTRVLSCAAKGGWMDVLCQLHGAQNRGTMTLPLVGWARIMGAAVDQAAAIIDELDAMKVADVTRDGNGNVTITNRRMLREAITREQGRLRVERHRRNKRGNAGGNGQDMRRSQKPETRSQKPEDPNPSEPPPAPRERNLLLDALCQYAELTDPLTAPPAIWPKLATALKRIREGCPGVTVDDIRQRAANYASHFRDAAISATALASHWGRCARPKEGTAMLDPQFDKF